MTVWGIKQISVRLPLELHSAFSGTHRPRNRSLRMLLHSAAIWEVALSA
jgi:hypothetical protein